MTKDEMIALLKKDVVPALGCTEPVCVALCAAHAGYGITGDIKEITVVTNSGIYKNGMSAGIPNCPHVGLDWASAIGANLKNPHKSMELFSDTTAETLACAKVLLDEGKVTVTVDKNMRSLYVKCTIVTDKETNTCIIQNAHTNVVFLERNGNILIDEEPGNVKNVNDASVASLMAMKIFEIRQLVDSASEEELLFMLDGVQMNQDLACYTEEGTLGVGLADSIREDMTTNVFSNDLMTNVVLKVTAGIENRLHGCILPTMSSSGSGAKGLMVILPVSEVAKAKNVPQAKIVRALAFAHLLNRYINAYVGKLAPMCSCVVGASTATSAGITYMLGGTDEQIGFAIRNMTGTVAGMLCDGGKIGCAMKGATGSFAALMSAMHALKNVVLRISDGICAATPEQCIKNMAQIGNNGMKDMDLEILDIMTSK